jgi:hypothetical protein
VYNIKCRKALVQDFNKINTASIPSHPIYEKKRCFFDNLPVWRNHSIFRYSKEYKLNLTDMLKNMNKEEEIKSTAKILILVREIMKGKDWEMARSCIISKMEDKKGILVTS